MPSWNAVHSEHVLSAMGECDELGDDEFLSRHGFDRAKSYVLWHKGRAYDSKTVLARRPRLRDRHRRHLRRVLR